MGVTLAHKQVMNIYIFYEIILWSYTKEADFVVFIIAY